jgi:hypothetical protein
MSLKKFAKKKTSFKKNTLRKKFKTTFTTPTGFKYNKKDFVLLFRQNSWVVQNNVFIHPEIFGKVQFYFIISYKSTNIFYTFLMKGSKMPTKNYIIAKATVGSINRKNKSEKNVQRGRLKKNYAQIVGRFAMFRRFCFDFFNHHPNLPSFHCTTVWKISKIDSLLIRMLNHIKYHKFNLEEVYEDYITKNKKDLPTSYTYTFHLLKSHGGLRPKKPRNIKKNRLKRMNKYLSYNAPEVSLEDMADEIRGYNKKSINELVDVASDIKFAISNEDEDFKFIKEFNEEEPDLLNAYDELSEIEVVTPFKGEKLLPIIKKKQYKAFKNLKKKKKTDFYVRFRKYLYKKKKKNAIFKKFN